jgi:hypothetical protein
VINSFPLCWSSHIQLYHSVLHQTVTSIERQNWKQENGFERQNIHSASSAGEWARRPSVYCNAYWKVRCSILRKKGKRKRHLRISLNFKIFNLMTSVILICPCPFALWMRRFWGELRETHKHGLAMTPGCTLLCSTISSYTFCLSGGNDHFCSILCTVRNSMPGFFTLIVSILVPIHASVYTVGMLLESSRRCLFRKELFSMK